MAPLHTHQIRPRAAYNRLHFPLYSAAIVGLLRRHATAMSSAATPTSLLLLLSDLLLTHFWFLSQGLRWRPIHRRGFPDRLPQASSSPVGDGLPSLDVFVCTADPYKEPPASVASNALSALAFDYPSDRLSVYVSDDDGSELTLFAFMEAANFARYWLPFCRGKGVMEISPNAYFHSGNVDGAPEPHNLKAINKHTIQSKLGCNFHASVRRTVSDPLSNPMAPLHTHQIRPRAAYNRLHFTLYSAAIVALLRHHATSISSAATPCSILLLLSDLLLALMWLLSQGLRWRPIHRCEFPDRLPQAASSPVGGGLPSLDVFVCTADPYKEPPASVASTALSALAFDYPTDRLSVYVSDDGGSELTLFAFMEAANFARYWLPFCREKGVMERSPDAYFHSGNVDGAPEAHKLKMMYKTLIEKVDSAMEKGFVDPNLINSEDEREIFKKWKNFTRQDHNSVIQVLLDSSTDRDITGHPLPNLVYVSREKHPSSPHHFKAGALNALVRVSEVMTNAPIILTLDCDMHSNDPNSPQRALCYLLDPDLAPSLAYVQFPQKFRGLNTNDIYAGEFRWLFVIHSQGFDGLLGPNYVGTCCFFSRRSLLGPPPAIAASFGESKACCPLRSVPILQKAHEAASCRHEDSQKWGFQVGFRYGSLVEDFYTGYRLHCQGWRSVFCNPERPSFLGDAPKNLSDALSQSKRWAVGLYQVCFSRYNPLFYGCRKASLLVGFSYMQYALWGTWCIPLTIYGLLPALALFNGVPLFPKASDPWFYLYAYLAFFPYVQELVEFMEVGGPIQRYWSHQRMWMIRGISMIFGTLEFILTQIRFSAPGFSLTSKANEEEQNKLYDNGKFYLGVASPFYVPLAMVAIVNLSSFILGFMKAVTRAGGLDEMSVQLLLSAFIVVNSWPVYEAMFVRKDGGRMPKSVTHASIFLASAFLCVGYILFNIKWLAIGK